MEAQAKRKAEIAKQRKINLGLVLVAVVVIAAGIMYFKVIRPNNIYNSAMKALNAGNYDEATNSFEQLGEYKDAVSLALESQYQKGLALLENGDYDTATAVFESLGEFNDAAIRIQQAEADKLYANGSYSKALALYNTLDEAYQTHVADYAQLYANAEKMLADGDYDGAKLAFRSIGDYADASKKALQAEADGLFANMSYDKAYTVYKNLSVEYQTHATDYEHMYANAKKMLSEKKYDEATVAFNAIIGYSDSETQAKESQYQKGVALLQIHNFDGATEVFHSISGYRDAMTQAKESQYQKGTALLAAKKYDQATEVFKAISDYNDASTMVKESQYQKAIALLQKTDYDAAYLIFSTLTGYKDVDSLIENDINISNAAFRAQLTVGNTVAFGQYEQDDDISNGMEPIEWMVLECDGKTATLISKYVLDLVKYGEANLDVTWESSKVRKWLNGDFLNSAFTVQEKELLQMNNVTADVNPEYSSDPGRNTQDRVFLLSVAEANKYFKSSTRVCRYTKYVFRLHKINIGGNDTESSGSYWLLRTPGKSNRYGL